MARTNVNDVKAIWGGITLGYSQYAAYINAANIFVTSTLSSAGLSAATLQDIERWITCHMMAITRDRLSKKAQAGTALIEYAAKYGAGLASTDYGQMAINLDTSGTLSSNLEGKKQAWIYAVTSFDYD